MRNEIPFERYFQSALSQKAEGTHQKSNETRARAIRQFSVEFLKLNADRWTNSSFSFIEFTENNLFRFDFFFVPSRSCRFSINSIIVFICFESNGPQQHIIVNGVCWLNEDDDDNKFWCLRVSANRWFSFGFRFRAFLSKLNLPAG